MQIGEFTLVNEEKVERAINGTPLDQGRLKGGVGIQKDKDGKVLNGAEILAEYDRLGGLVRKGKHTVKMGCFFDFKNTKKPFDEPKVMLVFHIEGEEVTVPADQPLPLEIQAAEIARERKAKRAAKKNVKKGKKNQDSDDEDETSEDDDDSDEVDEEDGELA